MSSTAAYLIFCTGDETVILEKDRKTAKILRSSDFVAVTNHDVSYDVQHDAEHTETAHAIHAKNPFLGVGMQDIVEESIDRKGCLVARWESWSREQGDKNKRTNRRSVVGGQEAGVPLGRIKQWMLEYPTSNEETHFVCIMDPGKGVFRWVRRFEESEVQQAYGETSLDV